MKCTSIENKKTSHKENRVYKRKPVLNIPHMHANIYAQRQVCKVQKLGRKKEWWRGGGGEINEERNGEGRGKSLPT